MNVVVAALEAVGRWVTPERARVYPRTILAALMLSGVLALPLAPLFGLDASPPVVRDFAAFYMAGHALNHGRSELLTDIEAQETYQHRLLELPTDAKWSPWVYPPVLAFAFAPLATLPYHAAWGASVVLLAGALWLALAMLRRELPGLPATRSSFWRALTFFPVFSCLLVGQVALFLLVPLAGFVRALRHGHEVRAGLWLGVFAVKPQLALGLGVLLLFRRQWRAAGTAVVTALAIFAASYVLLPNATVQWFTHAPQVLRYMRQGASPSWGSYIAYGPFGSASLLLHSLSPELATAVGVAITLGLLFAFTRLPRHESPSGRLLTLAAGVTLALLLSPHLYVYDLALLLVPFWLVLSSGALERAAIRGAVALVYAGCFLGTYLSLAQVTVSETLFGHGMAIQFGLIAILFAVWAILRAASDPPRPRAASRSDGSSAESRRDIRTSS
ncbi:MAG: DUF2029 domain-containing protein [Deltaproteobacteria bacterium]|nr:DUF2029 domain-containing protein [Deltaproteobacteria bacterium]